jgi:nicotinic acid phosphoribosyltransferase
MTIPKMVVTPENYQDYLEFEDFKVVQGNPIKRTDTYNLSHQSLKINTDWEVSHIYNRKRGMILFGFNKIVRDLMETRVTEQHVHVAQAHAIRKGMPFPYEMWMRVVTLCNGHIPIKIEALPDGRWCPKGTPFAQVRNTIEGFGELVTWFEGVLLKAAFPSGCATRAFEMRKYLESKAAQHGFQDNPLVLWRIHSFGFRGENSDEDAYWAGTAWSSFLPGTDDFHISWYHPEAVMGSIRALAHKVTQQFDAMSAEDAQLQYFINKVLPGDVVAMLHAIEETSLDPNPNNRAVALVIDTYDAMKVINHYVVEVAYYAKLHGVHVVFRPDSGDVLEQIIMIYWKLFHANLLDAAHCIIGEGINFDVVQEYDKRLEQEGIPLMFLFYGMGAGFFKDIERDSTGMAEKTAYSNGADRMKLVLTAPEKSSIPGKVQLGYVGGMLTIIPEEDFARYGIPSEYQILYAYSDDEVHQTEQTLSEIQTIALQQSDAQGRISMSPEILAKIDAQRVALIGG